MESSARGLALLVATCLCACVQPEPLTEPPTVEPTSAALPAGEAPAEEPVAVDAADEPKFDGLSLGATATSSEVPVRDFNGNGVEDLVDILTGTSKDEDGNGIPDEVEGPEQPQ